MVSTAGNVDPFVGHANERASQESSPPLVSYLTFSMDNGRFARTSKGDRWDPSTASTVRTRFDACFDGHQYRTLLDESSIPFALGAIENTDHPGEQLTVGTTAIPFLLSYSPLRLLSSLGYQTRRIVEKDVNEYHNGVECKVLEVPRGNSAWEGLVYVDSSIDYLPVRFVASYEDILMQDISMSYKPNESVGWVVSDWESKYFGRTGEIERSVTGHVTAVSINKPLEDSLFKLQFPVGSNIVWDKKDGKEFYIQNPNGELRPISRKEYGAMPRSGLTSSGNGRRRWFLVALTAVVAAVLLTVVVQKRFRGRCS